MNVGQHLIAAARRFPEKAALIFEGTTWSFRALDLLANRAANAFAARGIGYGDRVAVMTWNLPEQIATFYGLLRIGAVPVPVNYRLAANEVRFILDNSGARFLVIDDDTAAVASELAGSIAAPMILIGQSDTGFATPFYSFLEGASDRAPAIVGGGEDTAFIMYTSGTTGRPKGAMRSHNAETFGALQMAAAAGFMETDICIHNKPLFHIAQLQLQVIPFILLGATAVLTRGFDVDETMDAVGRHGITALHMVPTQMVMTMNADLRKYDLRSLRIGYYGGQTLNDQTTLGCMALFPERFQNIYGATEVLSATVANYRSHPSKLGTVGYATPGTEIRILNPGATDPDDIAPAGATGEIVIRTPAVMKGYLGLAERNAKSLVRGWYFTGDGGMFDEDGCLTVFGRLDFTIKSGGENIHPSEVENVLFNHPRLKDAAVIGLPSEKWGDVVVAAVIARDPALTAADLDRYCTESPDLANFKRPRHWFFVDHIPSNSTGKVERPKLRQQLLDSLDRPLP